MFVLLSIGLVLISWYELLFTLFPYVMPITPDTRVGKGAIALIWALALSLYGLTKVKNLTVTNKSLLCLVFLSMLTIYIGPKFTMEINGVDMSNAWMWTSFVRVLVFFLMFLVLSSIEISKKEISSLINAFSLTITVMAGYAILQSLGFEQFFTLKGQQTIGDVTSPTIIGNLGQPTIVAPLFGIGAILSLHEKRFRRFIICLIAILLTKSLIAIGTLGVSLLFYFFLVQGVDVLNKRFLAVLGGLLIICAVWFNANFLQIKASGIDNGRFGLWAEIVGNIKNQKIGDNSARSYPFTGAGLRSFEVIHSTLNDVNKWSKWKQAHNLYLEITYCLGFLGLFLSISSIRHGFMGAYWHLQNMTANKRVLITFLSVCFFFVVISCGTFIIYLSPYDYIFVMAFAFLHNPNILKGESQ